MTLTPTLTTESPQTRFIRRYWPYLLLVGVLAVMFLALAISGFELGFVGDVLAYEYHYDRLGIQGGMNWLVNVEWRRHLLASIYSAPVHLLFPGQSAAWYGVAFFIHFVNGVMVFLLTDTIMRGRRWVSFSAALAFVFHTLQIVSHFEYPTGSHRKAAMFLALLSLWLFLQYIRNKRQNRWWREFSLATYMVAVASYEQTAFFFLLHPIIAFFEDRPTKNWLRWLIRVALDSFWYPLFFAVYLFVLSELYIDNDHVALSANWIVEQITGALRVELSPVEFWSRLAPAFEGGWLLLTLAVGTGLFILLWQWQNRDIIHSTENRAEGEVFLLVFGAAIILVTILAVSPTTWALPGHPRLIYPTSVGFAMVVSGGLSLLLRTIPNTMLRQVGFALMIALLVGGGVTRTFQVRQEYAREYDEREAVKTAILEALPSWQGDALPYLLIFSDAHPTRDLALHAQDVRFPLMFDMLYDMDGIAADAIYPDISVASAPAEDMPGSRYNGPFIVVEPEGIYSPLNPRVPIDPQRLVIIYYDSEAQTAQVLDELPAEVLASANIIQRAPIEWRTNYDLFGP